ncbi:MAG: hypothetical protein LQ343_007678 [Gyalolechia ehrenbergii]|nr:MAG: hypothetical protein LQ343_007678 [Gyalolechia ehrenbergii]
MNAYGDQRQHSPAFQGAQQAFSSPSAAQRSPDTGALVAASRVGTGERRTAGEDGPSPDTLYERRKALVKQQRENATTSYIAANLAARRSAERLPSHRTTLPVPTPTRPAPLRAHSNISTSPTTNGLSINALISRYDGQTSRASRGEHLHLRPDKRPTSPGTLESDTGGRSMGLVGTFQPLESQKSLTPSRSSSSSSGNSSYTSAVGDPPRQPQAKSAQTALDPPVKSFPRPVKRSEKGPGNDVRNCTERQRSRILSDHTIPQLSADSLANAMVASSLASSRAPSPTRPPLPLPRRHSRPHLFPRTKSAETPGSRTPSPSKGTMRTTMRAPLDPNPEVADKHKGNRFINKHPNKHHEGDRKRWRDQITELERKRYEGVWAANRGLLTSYYQVEPLMSVDLANSVLNVVVRDIWSRSRLPLDVLEEIWELVDTSGNRLLSKEEFVVGMWLVDQRLKGRKLPVKVSDSVWFSSRGLTGIKVRKHY